MNFQFINCNLLIEGIFLPLFAENFLTFAVSHLTFPFKVELVFGLHSSTLLDHPHRHSRYLWETSFEMMWQQWQQCNTSKVSQMTNGTQVTGSGDI